jgi:WD40 repeat protein
VAARKEYLTLDGPRSGGQAVTFHPTGDLLAGNDWEGVLRLWDTRTGAALLSAPASASGWLAFSPDGRFLVPEYLAGKLRILEVGSMRACRTLVRERPLGPGDCYGSAVHPGGRLLAVGTDRGVELWDLASGRALAHIPLGGRTWSVLFEPSGALLACGQFGLVRWPVRPGPDGVEDIWIDPGEKLLARYAGMMAASSDRRVVAVCLHGGALVLNQGPGGPAVEVRPRGDDVRGVGVSPDGRWVATGPHNESSVKVWDARSGALVKELPLGTGSPIFSPDGKWLAVAGDHARLWRVADWQPGPRVPNGKMAFSPDGRLIAIDTRSGVIHLIDPATGGVYARLEDPNLDRAHYLGFSPDGTQLIGSCAQGRAVRVWDLREIRRQLAEMGLDWDLPPYPPAADEGPPLHVVVE